MNIVFRSAAVGLYYSRDDDGTLVASKRLRTGLSSHGDAVKKGLPPHRVCWKKKVDLKHCEE